MDTRFVRLLAAALFPVISAFAQPVISSQSPIASSASYRAYGLPGSGIAQGSIFSIFGSGLGPDPWAQASTFPLPTRLGGSSVDVTVGGTTTHAIVVLAYSTQINAVLPSSTPIGAGTATVTYNQQTSAPAPIQVVASAFAPFTYNQMGYGQAIATDTSYVKNTIIHTFHPSDYVLLWGTGLGAINGSDADAPTAGNLPVAVTVHVGNVVVSPSYFGRAPCCAGLDQIVFQVPTGVEGCYVPLGVETRGVVGTVTTIAVSSTGQTCSDSILGQDLVNKLAAGQKVDFGYIRLESLISNLGQISNYVKEDNGMASFSELDPAAAGLAQYGVSNGYCYAADRGISMNLTLSDSSPAQLDAGSLAVTWRSTVSLSQMFSAGYYQANLDSQSSTFLWSGNPYVVAGTGGAGVGAFSVSDTTATGAVQFSNIVYAQKVPRTSDFQIQWTGGNSALQNGQVTIGGYSSATSDFTEASYFQCTAPLSAGQFAIPAWILSGLPSSGTGQNGAFSYPLGWIWIGQYNKPTEFSATGLDRGIITDIFYQSAGIYFQ